MNTRGITTRLLAPLGLSALLLTTPAAMAQPADAPPPRAEGPSAERLAEGLQKRLERLEAEQAVLEQALADLEAGADPADVGSELRERTRKTLRDRAGELRERGERGPRGERGFRGRGPGMQDRPFAEGDVDRILEFVEQHRPELHQKLTELREFDPEAFEKMVGKRAHKLRALAGKAREAAGHSREVMEQRLELDREIKQTIEGLNAPEEALVDPALRALLEQRIDLETQFQQERIDRMTRHLEELENEFEAQVADRDSLVTEKLVWIAESMQKREDSQD